MDVRFGATIVQVVPFPAVLDDFRFAESIGLDNAWVIDQFGIDEAPDIALLEAWTTLAAVATDTERIGIGTLVTNAAMRHPADCKPRQPPQQVTTRSSPKLILRRLLRT